MSLSDDRLIEYYERHKRHMGYIRNFSDRHELLWTYQINITELFEDIDYFKNDPFLEIEDIVAQTVAELSSWLPEVEPVTSAPPAPTDQLTQASLQQLIAQHRLSPFPNFRENSTNGNPSSIDSKRL